jgi:rRNA maturation RNase YbeY
MTVAVINHQRLTPVPLRTITRLARHAARHLRIGGRGVFSITFIADAQMKRLNRRFTGHQRFTDVLSFRYDGEPIVGEVLIAPRQAQRYAAAHGGSYREELARYVVHGLLHWLGHDDRTQAQQLRMRRLENQVLSHCGIEVSNGAAHR